MLKKFKQDYPKYKNFFNFQQFNQVQKKCFPKIFTSQGNIIVSAPTGSGKTVLFQLLILKMINQRKTKCLYLAPIKSLCQQKTNHWKQKFLSTMQVMQLTGDTLQMQNNQFDGADIYVATPQKIDYISRKNLNFLRQLNLLLIDQIHMLNMQDRGAILQAIVTRIISINKNIRVMAVSATIPNIKQVAQWLKVPKQLICIFGEQYRPVKLHKVVLGFKSANNDFNFQKMLNFKVLQIIREYSCGGGSLIFCQTQKGTEQACNKIISQIRQRQFVNTQIIYKNLTDASKLVDNTVLKNLLPQGVAFHNASLSMKDRSIVQKLFLDLKIKVLCTTSTLAMGINLPARLVIIKSTKCYKGSGKGYQQYNQIQIDQMMGRAGRIPFDTEGTVVIMTQKQNYNKYLGDNKLQNLQSQLFSQLIDHLNTQISLKSVQNLTQAQQYFQNSFCYIRMLKDPNKYKNEMNIKFTNIDQYIKKTIYQLILKLSNYGIIQFIEQSGRIFPKQCSMNISRNAIQVDSIIKIIQSMNDILNQRQFIQLFCKASQFTKYRSKLDQRKCLKDCNEKLKYSLKQTISTSDKKTFVLIQSQLSGIYIQSWQMRKQSKQIINFTKRLSYCIKSLAIQRKNTNKTFYLYLFSSLFHKYCTLGFWEENNSQVLKQINRVDYNWKNITARGIRNIDELIDGLDKLDIFQNNISSLSLKTGIQQELSLLRDCIQISIKKAQNKSVYQQNNQNNELQIHQNNFIHNNTNNPKQLNQMLRIIFTKNFTEKLKSITIMIQHLNSIYHSGIISRDNPQFSVFLKNTHKQKYFIAVIKQGYIGFDQFYNVENGQLKKTILKRQNQKNNQKNNKSLIELNKYDINNNDSNNKSKSNQNKKRGRKPKSFDVNINTIDKNNIDTNNKSNNRSIDKKITTYEYKKVFSKKVLYNNDIQSYSKQKLFIQPSRYQQKFIQKYEQKQLQPNSNTLKIKRSKQLKLTQDFNTIKRKYIHDQDNYKNNPLSKQIKKPQKVIKYGDLKSYNWKPGFQAIKDDYNQKAYYQNDTINQSNKLKNKKLLFDQNDQQNQHLNKNDIKYYQQSTMNDLDFNDMKKCQYKDKNNNISISIKQQLNNYMNDKLKQRKNQLNHINKIYKKQNYQQQRTQQKYSYPIFNTLQQNNYIQTNQYNNHNNFIINNKNNLSFNLHKQFKPANQFMNKNNQQPFIKKAQQQQKLSLIHQKNKKINFKNNNNNQMNHNIKKQKRSAFDYFDSLFQDEQYQI